MSKFRPSWLRHFHRHRRSFHPWRCLPWRCLLSRCLPSRCRRWHCRRCQCFRQGLAAMRRHVHFQNCYSPTQAPTQARRPRLEHRLEGSYLSDAWNSSSIAAEFPTTRGPTRDIQSNFYWDSEPAGSRVGVGDSDCRRHHQAHNGRTSLRSGPMRTESYLRSDPANPTAGARVIAQ
jgi:hypothetical protein